MFFVGEFSFEALVCEDVADFRGITAAVGALEEEKMRVIQFDVMFFRRWSARVLEPR